MACCLIALSYQTCNDHSFSICKIPRNPHQCSFFKCSWYPSQYVAKNYVLTLNMLNCFKVYKKSIKILNHISDLACPKKMKFTLGQRYMSFVLHSQYHACCCSVHFRSQGISSHGIDPRSRTTQCPASEELNNDNHFVQGTYQWLSARLQ